MFWALKPGECPKGTILAGARKNRQIRCSLRGKQHSEIVKRQDKILFFFFSSSLYRNFGELAKKNGNVAKKQSSQRGS